MNNSQILNQFTHLISHFYRQIIRKHSNKTQLLSKLNKLLHLVSRQQIGVQRMTGKSAEKSPRNRSAHSSRERILSENTSLAALQSGVEWSCEWFLVRQHLSNILIYIIIHSLISVQNFWQFQRIKEELIQKLQATSLGQTVLFKISLQLQKISKLFFTNKKDCWQHFLIEILKRLPKEVISFILESYSIYDVDNVDEGKLYEFLKQLALKLKIKINYFQLDCKRIVANKRYGISEIQYNFGYVGMMDKYTLANRFPVLSEDRAKKMQDLQHFQMNLSELIKQYEENGVRLNQIQCLKNYVSVENKIKEFINTKK